MIGNICKKYALYYLAAAAISIGIGFLYEAITAKEISSGLTLTITTMIPALWAGHTWFKETATIPEPGTSWSLAFRFTGIQIAFSSILVVYLVITAPELTGVLTPSVLGIFVFAFLFASLLVLLMSRFFFAMGAKQAAKAANAL